jgi:hypothetical protein
VCTSLEEWATTVFKPNVHKRLEQAILSNSESKERWDRHVKKLEDRCNFLFTYNQDFTEKGNTKQEEEESTTLPTPIDYNQQNNQKKSLRNP